MIVSECDMHQIHRVCIDCHTSLILHQEVSEGIDIPFALSIVHAHPAGDMKVLHWSSFWKNL